ncbi:hypothetical protein E8E11_006196 [Didymella keratinophila]|nr:hypothetical protein E8E11_006196 [Didymella keratinophila]
MPGLVMEPNLASARPSRTTTKATYSDTAAAAQSVVKAEDDYEDDDGDVYRSRPQLQEPEVLMRDLADLTKMLQAGTIDIDPEYQRDVVWTADRMTGLINSLMENFYIPPIILNKKPRPNPDASAPQEVYVCVDGKQRLSSVLAFVRGMIACHDRNGEKWYFSEAQGSKRRHLLSEQQQREFLRKHFVIFEYNDLSPEQEEDLFARVQMGVQLNLAEKMRASTGPWQELARLFVEDFPTVFALIKDRARSKDFQLALSCFSQIVECMHPTAANGVPILKTNHTHLPKLLSNKGAVDDALKSHLASVWNTLRDLIDVDPDTFTNANKYLRGVQTFAPVEMVAVTVLISMHFETRNNRLLLGDIQTMRTAVRESFVDLRMNATVWKWYWDYIENLEAIRGAIDGSTMNRKTKQRTKKKDALPTGGATVGPTVTAITAAAAAPKKGRFTARTKRPTEASIDETPEETSSAVKKEPVKAPMPAPPPSKRRRTEATLSAGFLDDGDLSNATWGSTLCQLRRSHVRGPNQLRQRRQAQHQYHDKRLDQLIKHEVKHTRLLSQKHEDNTSNNQIFTYPHPGLQVLYVVVCPNIVRINQHDEPIDLTSDTEQERASLLSTFKTRSVSAGASKNTSKPAPEPASQKRKAIAKEPQNSS